MSDFSGTPYTHIQGAPGSNSPSVSHSSSHRINLPNRLHVQNYVPRSGLGKYKNAMSTLLPLRFSQSDGENTAPVDQASLFSHMTLFWVTKFFYTTQLEACVSPLDSCDINCQRFQELWRTESVKTGQKGMSLMHITWRFIRTRVIVASILYILSIFITIFTSVFCVNNLIKVRITCDHVNNTHTDNFKYECTKKYMMWIGVFIAAEIIALLLLSWSKGIAHRTAIRLCSAYMGILYKKVVQISARNNLSVIKIVMLLITDSRKLYHLVTCGPYIIFVPSVYLFSTICLCLYFYSDLYSVIIVVFVSAALILLLLFIFAKVECRLTNNIMKLQSLRLTAIVEMISNISLIKMCGLEKLFIRNIEDKRRSEIRHFSWTTTHRLLGFTLSHVILLCTLVGYFTHFHSHNYLSDNEMVKKYAIFLIIFIHIRNSLFKFWIAVKSILQASRAMRCLKDLSLLNTTIMYERPHNRNIDISIIRGCFTWSSSTIKKTNKRKKKKKKSGENEECMPLNELEPVSYTLKDIDFEAWKGKLIGICGDVRSGKSSLLLAILGQLKVISGEVQRQSGCAYASQTPWICNGTLKDNVVFKSYMDNTLYYNTVTSCFLNEEQHGDMCLEKCYLSMGEKQKIALARAIYSYKNTLLLDEPLSAVDVHTASEIFGKVILPLKNKKTIILATGNIRFLAYCDDIYLLADGEIVDHGTHETLLQDTQRYKQLVSDYMRGNKENYYLTETNSKKSQVLHSNKEASISRGSSHADLQHIDTDDSDPVHINTCPFYFQHISGIWYTVTIIMIIVSITVLAGLPFYFMIDVHLDNKANVSASLGIHTYWLIKLIKSQIKVFKNFTTSDIFDCFYLCFENIDDKLSFWIFTCVENTIWTLIPIVILGYTCYWTLIPITVYVFCLIPLIMFYRKGYQKLNEENKLAVLPLIDSMVNDTLGRIHIEAFGKGKDFFTDFTTLCDKYAANLFILNISPSSLAVWVALLSAITLGAIIVLLAADTQDYRWFTLGLVSAFQLAKPTQRLSHSVIEYLSKLHNVSSKNILIQNVERENDVKQNDLIKIPASWPTNGTIIFKDVSMGLGPEVSASLCGMNFNIESGENIGIVEKAGSRTTQIVTALYRLNTLTTGKIYVSGTNITKVPLETLRSSISIIPYDPLLLKGILRLNLDPYNIYGDSEIKDRLEEVGLSELLDSLHTVPHLEQLSIGEKQLLYMAKALLNKTKILIFEQALEPVTRSEEEKLRNAIKNSFKNTTVLILAQSPHLIACCDRVIIVDKGQVVEFDSPVTLSMNRNSLFSRMMGNSFETSL